MFTYIYVHNIIIGVLDKGFQAIHPNRWSNTKSILKKIETFNYLHYFIVIYIYILI